MANRYNQLLQLIEFHKPVKIAEIGTQDGTRALLMCEEALKHQKEVMYWGFDLFEDATDESDARELNVKRHASLAEVEAKLKEFADKHEGFQFVLTKGDTRETLKDFQDSDALDFVFIDGGHSVETIKADILALKDAKVVVLDDFYEKDSDGKIPDLKKFGCNNVLYDLNLDHTVLEVADPVRGGGVVKMAVLGTKHAAKKRLVIKTLNCVRDEKIAGNVRYATSIIPREKFVRMCRPHGKTAVVVASGPSMAESFDKIRAHQANGDLVFCVKSAHHKLIEAGIIPWGCILLDPRIDVLKWVTPAHKDVRYFVATMCYPDIVEHVVDSGSTYFAYNAYVGAGEQEALAEFDERERKKRAEAGDETPVEPSFMIQGGSTAATRAIGILYQLGFRTMELYGYDSCYFTEPNMAELTKTGKKRYSKVTVAGKDFWTEGQLLAQTNDFQIALKSNGGDDLSINVHGDGMLAHVWRKVYKPKPDFSEVFAA